MKIKIKKEWSWNKNQFVVSDTTIPTIPVTHTLGESCDDANVSTSDDVYLADGITCQWINKSGIYLDSNGIIIKCENAITGSTGNLNVVDYKVVENGTWTNGIFNATIWNAIVNGTLKVCTSKGTSLSNGVTY
jgi:hypothetical protein